MKTKSLKGSSSRGYESMGSQRSLSVTTVSYQQTWSIDAPTTLPVFTQDDALGTDAALATNTKSAVASGRTRFTTTEVTEGGRVLRGEFVRDENRAGDGEGEVVGGHSIRGDQLPAVDH